ncbi:hypothetical protein OQA88_13440 [Cercophora sp. LCS_1]
MDWAWTLAVIPAEVASHAVGTGQKLTIDTATTLTKIANDGVGVAVKIASDTASTVVKIADDSASTFAKVVSDGADTVTKVANDTGETARLIFRGDIASVPGRLLHDSLGTGAKIATDTAGSLAKITKDTAGTASKVASDLAGTASGVINASSSTGGKIVSDGDTSVSKVGDDVLETAAHVASRALSSRGAGTFLELVTDTFSKAGDAQIIDAILQLMQRSLAAVGRSLSGAAVIWHGIFTNSTNEAHLRFILDHLYDLFRFIYDLCRPGTVIPEGRATDGTAKNGSIDGTTENELDIIFPGINNPYNELDLRISENRRAIVNQVRRVVKTLVKILKMGRKGEGPSPSRGLDDLEMDMSLASDFDKDGNPVQPTYLSTLENNKPSKPGETWLFVNGIANEYVWLQRSCDKIRDAFGREVKGIYNRTDGILWDLIECFGEHSTVGKKNKLIERTKSSTDAQATLERELRSPLLQDGPGAPKKIVMIAHSQGCLVLRLALQNMVADATADGPRLRHNMKKRLRVFTFASPAIDWLVLDGDGSVVRPLSGYAHLTEHYAHEADFVSVLGVVTHRRGYERDPVFHSKGGRGHLFGAHYPLRKEDYQNGDNSELFKALRETKIA